MLTSPRSFIRRTSLHLPARLHRGAASLWRETDGELWQPCCCTRGAGSSAVRASCDFCSVNTFKVSLNVLADKSGFGAGCTGSIPLRCTTLSGDWYVPFFLSNPIAVDSVFNPTPPHFTQTCDWLLFVGCEDFCRNAPGFGSQKFQFGAVKVSIKTEHPTPSNYRYTVSIYAFPPDDCRLEGSPGGGTAAQFTQTLSTGDCSTTRSFSIAGGATFFSGQCGASGSPATTIDLEAFA